LGAENEVTRVRLPARKLDRKTGKFAATFC
jgi:hypothetical protein